MNQAEIQARMAEIQRLQRKMDLWEAIAGAVDALFGEYDRLIRPYRRAVELGATAVFFFPEEVEDLLEDEE